jgi:hypothetical protein
MNQIYQPYLYQNSGNNSRRQIALSNRGLIASQEIKESEFGKRNKKGSRVLKSNKSRKKLKSNNKEKNQIKKKKSKRKFDLTENGK